MKKRITLYDELEREYTTIRIDSRRSLADIYIAVYDALTKDLDLQHEPNKGMTAFHDKD